MDILLNDSVTMKKPHACGFNSWKIVRIGADIGILCNHCNRKIVMSRSEFLKIVKKIEHTPESTKGTGNVIINRLEQK